MATKRKNNKISNFVIIILLTLVVFLILFKIIIPNIDNNKNDKQINEIKQNNDIENKEKIEKETKKEIDNLKPEEEPSKDEKEENNNQISNNAEFDIELIGDEEITLNVGDKYNELGAKAINSNGIDVSKNIKIDSNVDTTKTGEYMVIYSLGKSIVVRTVYVK